MPPSSISAAMVDNDSDWSGQVVRISPASYRSKRPLMHRQLITALICIFLSPIINPLTAVTLEVGPNKTYSVPSQASAVARDGDTIRITAGTYPGDVCYWRASNLTITGVGGFAHLASAGAVAGGKGIWVVTGNSTTIENIEFSGAACPDLNGAGIRLEGSGLTVRGCFFHHNQDGILANAGKDSDVLIEHSEFAHNGAGDGYSHNLYIGNVRTLTFRYNYSHHAKIGHCLKSRAQNNYIIANRIMDEDDGTSSYTIDLPNGGLSFLIGNLIQQGPHSENPGIISVAAEGGTNAIQRLYLINNTIVNDGTAKGIFVNIGKATTLSRAENNILLGPGTAFNVMPTVSAHNLISINDPGLINRAAYHYRLRPGSIAINAGTDLGSADGYALLPLRQYVHPHSDEARSVGKSAIDIGAYEFTASLSKP